MNMLKVCNSAEFVNYVKPEVTMIEMEVEGSLLLTASDEPTGGGPAPGMSAGNGGSGSTIGNNGNVYQGSFSVNKSRVRR
jgi:hypothetical protein